MDNQRLILVIALSLVIFLIYNAWVEEQRAVNPPPPEPVTQQSSTTDGTAINDGVPALPPAGDSTTSTAADKVGDVPTAVTPAATPAVAPATSTEQRIKVITDEYIAEIDPVGGTLVKTGLLNYPESLERKEQPVFLLNDTPLELFIAQSGLMSAQPAPDHYQPYSTPQNEYRLAAGQDKLEVPLTWTDESGISVVKTYTFHRNSFAIDVVHKVINNSATDWTGRQYRQLQRRPPPGSNSGGLGTVYTYTGGVISTPEDPYEKIDFDEMAEMRQTEVEIDQRIEQILKLPPANQDQKLLADLRVQKNAVAPEVRGGWTAMIQHYFLAAWIPDQESTNKFYTNAPGGERYVLGMYSSEPKTIAAGSSDEFHSLLYVGPKKQDALKELAPNLERTVDYGFLWFIAEPLFWLLEKIHSFVGNWGWSIIILTIMIKAAFYKLSETSYRSMANMRKLAPQMQKLKDRYGDDRQKMNQAMMEMYKKEKINPLGGCLPILVQIPVFIALYWMLLESVELRQAPWIGWIQDLASKDPYYILPLIMGASMFVQQQLNPTPPDPIQAKVMMALPIVFTFFFLWFPAGLVLYWVVNNLLSILQQYIITKRVEAGTDKAKSTG